VHVEAGVLATGSRKSYRVSSRSNQTSRMPSSRSAGNLGQVVLSFGTGSGPAPWYILRALASGAKEATAWTENYHRGC
jgi:hypothetical protein